MGFSDPREAWPRYEKPCIYRYSCGFDFCTMSECEHYEAKTKDNKYYGRSEKQTAVAEGNTVSVKELEAQERER